MLTHLKAVVVFAEENALKIRKMQLYCYWCGGAKMATFEDPSTKLNEFHVAELVYPYYFLICGGTFE